MRFGEPLDPFGNRVDEAGESRDPRGRGIDTTRYLWVDGRVAPDRARDAEYTRECGRAVADAFRRHTVAVSTAFLSFTLFQHLRERYPDLDLYRLLRVIRGESIPVATVRERADRLRESLRDLAAAGRVHLSHDVERLSTPDLVEKAVRVLGMYHATPVVERRGEQIAVTHPNLLYYYANRLAGYGLEATTEEPLHEQAAQ
jgi:glycerol-3-phosphate O-acyltransferase